MATRKILLIDDDADDREMFCEALEAVAPDFICYTAVNGSKALASLESNEFETPDLIFLDINMPVMDGWQCLAVLKGEERYKSIPVIMYSTSSYPEEVDKARQSGALCFFTKPSGFTELKKSLALVAEYMKKASLESLIYTAPFFHAPSA